VILAYHRRAIWRAIENTQWAQIRDGDFADVDVRRLAFEGTSAGGGWASNFQTKAKRAVGK